MKTSENSIEQYCIERKHFMLSAKQRTRYADIDAGIMTCGIELALMRKGISFTLAAHALRLPDDCAGCAQMNAATFIVNV